MIKLTKNHPNFDGIKWVLGVTSLKGDVRNHIRYTYVKGGDFVKTDGGRLHKYKLKDELGDGFYEVVKNIKSEVVINFVEDQEGWQYLDYKELFNTEEHKIKLKGVCSYNGTCYKAYADVIRALDINTLQYEYMRDILSDDNSFNVFVKDDNSPIVFIGGEDREALLMPFKINKEILDNANKIRLSKMSWQKGNKNTFSRIL